MLTFNDFGSINPVASVSKRLRPWGIYKVKYAGSDLVQYENKQDPNNPYVVLKIAFEGEEGKYEESIFSPTDADADRREYTNKSGHVSYMPSNWERNKIIMSQILNALNPTGYAKLQALQNKIKSFKDLCNAFITTLKSSVGKETTIKLVGKTNKDGNVVAVSPRCCAINNKKELFISDNFIGDNLFFTPWEEGEMAKYNNKKPDIMPELGASNPDILTPENDTEDELDFSSLE